MQNSRTRTVAVLLAVLLAGATMIVPAAAQPTDEQAYEGASVQTYALADANNTTADNHSESPGALLSGVLGVQQAEFQGSIERAAFGLRVANAASQNATASIVGEQLEETQTRLDELQAEKQALIHAHENGSIDNATFRAEMAAVATEIQTAEQLATQTGSAAEGLPEDVLQSQGVNVTAIQTLQTQAANLSGPEVAKIAQSIAGPRTDAATDGVPDFVDIGEQDGNETADAGNETASNPGEGADAGPTNATDGGSENGPATSSDGEDTTTSTGQPALEGAFTFAMTHLTVSTSFSAASVR